MVFCTLISNISCAYVVRKVDIPLEKIIPFSFITDDIVFEEDIDIEGLDNVKIEKVYVDNGDINAYVDDEYICVELKNGEKSNSLKKLTKTDTLEIEDMPLTNEGDFIIELDNDKKIKDITEVSGDFESAKVNEKGNIEVKVSKNAKGIKGYDESKRVKSEVIISIDQNNKERMVESEWINLEHEIIGQMEAISGDTSAIDEIFVEDNSIKVRFDGGTPKLNETAVSGGYTYFWIDRDADGIFKKYNPNSIYNTDKNKISGNGEYLDESEIDQLGMNFNNTNWTDYCGAEINGIRYIYPFKKEKGSPSESCGDILLEDFMEVKERAFNTEKYTVYFSEKGVLYVPEGKLYSMGELVKGTSGWGETAPNRDWESKETFFNEITGKYETYVKHYKFFYGPEKKKAFGGFYTYPYSCKLEYEHYKPANLYSGQIIYTYDVAEYVRGYSYNGWVKISYTENKTVNDYPPTAPYNIEYDSNSKIISWNHGMDDYTPQNKLSYQMQMYAGFWEDIININSGKNSISYTINYDDYDIRVRTVDEMGQVSEWAKLSDNMIELSGKVTPSVIKAGETLKITANTKSLSKIASVTAKSDELGINSKLNKIFEEVPDYFEMSYDIMADFLEVDEYLYAQNGRYAKTIDGEYWNHRFTSRNKSNNDVLEIEIPDHIDFTPNGTIIFPNGNYLNSPQNIFTYNNNKKYYLHRKNGIGIRNKVTGNKEWLVAFETDENRKYVNGDPMITFVHRLVINTFEYDEDGKPNYALIEVDKNISDKPIVIRWNTDVSCVTTIDIDIENKNIYSYKVNYDVLETYIKNIEYERLEKYVKRYIRMSSGYSYPSNKFVADWAKIVLNVIPYYNLEEFLWLGYKVANNEYVRDTYITNYNNNPAVKNTYRTLILDEYASNMSVNKYINLIKTTNIPISNDDGESVFGDDVVDYNCEFSLENINTNSNVLPGKYDIELTATDVDGNSNKIILSVIVENEESQMYPEEEEFNNPESSEVKDVLVGRFFYKNDQGYLEELKKIRKNSDTEGFICAGETIGFDFIVDNAEFLEIDFIGDSSIKTLDSLTKLFLIDKPNTNGKDVGAVKAQYEGFPKRIYPKATNENSESEFRYFYTIPYETKQSIHSWSTLRNSILEKIDKNKLFNRIKEPYILKIKVNGDENNSYEVPFDVFERWDTVINRNVSEYVTNSESKWEIRIDKDE